MDIFLSSSNMSSVVHVLPSLCAVLSGPSSSCMSPVGKGENFMAAGFSADHYLMRRNNKCESQ